MRDRPLAYGMGAKTLQEQLSGEGYPITLTEARDLFARYKKTFKTAIDWLESQQRTASKQLHMVNINGRRRVWRKPNLEVIKARVYAEETKNGRIKVPEHKLREEVKKAWDGAWASIEREGANFGIQTVNADMTKKAMAADRLACKALGYDSRMYNSVYDEIVKDSHKSCAQEAHELQKKVMIDAANSMLKRVPMEVEGHLKTHWTK
jgi:DNA polymerase I-like protein with 3'-5' exonuclease and polymerase domains